MVSNYTLLPGGTEHHSAHPIVLTDYNNQLVYTNKAFKSTFGIFSKTLNDLKCDPPVAGIVSSFISSALQDFSLEVYIPFAGNYKLYISRISIRGEDLVLINFNSLQSLSFIEDKINLLTAALENEKMPIMLTNDQGVIIFSTSSFEKVLNLPIDCIYNHDLKEVLNGYLSTEDLNELSFALVSGKKWGKVAPTINSSGKRIYREFSLLPVRFQSDAANFIITAYDVSDQQFYKNQVLELASKETKLLKMKTALLENMSHEIRTPLTAIKGYSEIIDECFEDGDYETLKDIALNLKDVLNRVLGLFTNIAEVSQIEFGEVSFEIVKLNVNQILKSIYNKKAEELHNSDISFNLLLPEEELSIEADWIKLDRIITLIVENAFKYTVSGEIIIRGFSEADKAVIVISDTGLGIDESELSRLIEPFTQAEEGSRRNYEGAGLGLTYAYKMTTLMGGIFNIYSKKGNGTTVKIEFPSCSSD